MSERSKMVEVSSELLAQLREWSRPVEVRIEDRDGVLEMVFRESAEVERLRAALVQLRLDHGLTPEGDG